MSKPQVLIDDLLRQSRVRATGTAPQLDLFSVFGASAQQYSFCGARLCAKHQPQRVVPRTAWYCADVLRLVGTTQPRSESK